MKKRIAILLLGIVLSACTEKQTPRVETAVKTKEALPMLSKVKEEFLIPTNNTVFDVNFENSVIDSYAGENEFFYTVNALEKANSSSYITKEIYNVNVDSPSSELQLIYTLDEAARAFDIKRFNDDIYITLIENRSENKLSKHKVVRLNEHGYEVLYEVMVDWSYDAPRYYVLGDKLFLTSLSVNTDDGHYLQEFKILVLEDNEFVTLDNFTCVGTSYSDCFQYQGHSSEYPDGYAIIQSYMSDAEKKIIWELSSDSKISKTELNEEIFSFAYVNELDAYISSSRNGISLWNRDLDENSNRLILDTEEMYYPMTIDGSDIYGTLGDTYNSITKVDLIKMTVAKQIITASIPDTVWVNLIIVGDTFYASLNSDSQIEIIELERNVSEIDG